MNQQPTTSKIAAYNEAVKSAYFKIVGLTEELIATIDDDRLRSIIYQVDENEEIVLFTKVHQLISPLCYLSLTCEDGQRLSISYTYGMLNDDDHSSFYRQFVRNIYELTAPFNTTVNISDCVEPALVLFICLDIYSGTQSGTMPYKAKEIPYRVKQQ
jgi:hypothetical protein